MTSDTIMTALPKANLPPSFASMPFYFRDFQASTATWPIIARGVYFTLLGYQWDIGGISPGVLPEDAKNLQKIVRISTREWKIAWQFCESKFPLLSGGGRQNARLELHRSKAVQRYMKKRLGANKTNNKRWGNGSHSDAETGSLSEYGDDR